MSLVLRIVYYWYHQWPEEGSGKVQPEPVVKSVVARRLMQSLGRIMAMYFSDDEVFVYLPHHQRHIPPLHRRQPSTGNQLAFFIALTSSIGSCGL